MPNEDIGNGWYAPTPATETVDAIIGGQFDADLHELSEAIQVRRKVLGNRRAAKATSLGAGTRVRLVGVSPSKANGATGTLDYSPFNGKLGIRLDNPIYGSRRTYNTTDIYTWPAQCYEVIS